MNSSFTIELFNTSILVVDIIIAVLRVIKVGIVLYCV